MHWGFKERVAAAVLALAAGTGTAGAQTLADARIIVSTDRPTFLLGENVLVHYCLENRSTVGMMIEVGGDSRGASRSQRFKVVVTNAAGAVMADPDPSGFHLGGLSSQHSVAPSARWCQPLRLMRYARIPEPGTYTVRVAHDLGWTVKTLPSGQTTVMFTMPDAGEAARVIASTVALPEAERDFSTLRYPVYLSALIRLVESGTPAALTGIGAMPSLDATRALMALMKHSDRVVGRSAARQLAMRLPDPALEGRLPRRGPFGNELEDSRRFLRDAGWRPELASDVRAAAVEWLGLEDPGDVIAGAFMVQAVGDLSSAPPLAAAMDRALSRTLTLPFEGEGYPRPRGAMQELQRAAEVLLTIGYVPPAVPATPAESVLWLLAFERGARPAEWDARLRELLSHAVPYIREMALRRVPADAPVALFEAVRPALWSTDMDLQIAALDVVTRAKLAAFADPVAALVRTATDSMLLNFASNALEAAAGRMAVLDIMAARLTEPKVFTQAIGRLFGVLDTRGHGGGPVSAEDATALSKRWHAFLAEHRTAIDAGKRFALTDPALTPDLVPRGWTIR